MFAGHIGAGLAIGRLERHVNVGVFIVAALLLDFMLWLFILFGWESAVIPPNFAETHQPEFAFPYSHGLVAALCWSAATAMVALAYFARKKLVRWRPAALLAGAVFSHWLLDALVHRPELPLMGAASPHFGLGLWQTMPLALVVEAAVVVVGLWLFLPCSGLSRSKSLGLSVLVFLALAITVAGMTIAPPPPSSTMMAASSFLTLLVVCVVAGWCGWSTHATSGRADR